MEQLKFTTPQEELAYLRSKVMEAEKKLEGNLSLEGRNEVVKGAILDHKEEVEAGVTQETLVAIEADAATLEAAADEAELPRMMRLAEEKGIFHALSVAEKLRDWTLEDDFHDELVAHVSKGLPTLGFKDKGEIYQALRMSLYEIILPKSEGSNEKPLSELVKSMEQFYAGLLSLDPSGNSKEYLVFEFANPEGEEETRAFASVPTGRRDLFERQVHAIFPNARLFPRERDYTIFSRESKSLGAIASLSSSAAYPFKTFEQFTHDPLNVILNGFDKIPAQRAGTALQIVFKPMGETYAKRYQGALKKIEKGEKPKEVLREEGIGMEIARTVFSSFFGGKKKEETPTIDQSAVEMIKRKLESPIVETNIRLAVSAPTEGEAETLMHNFQSAFNQFEETGKQSFKWNTVKAGRREGDFYRAFSFRLFRDENRIPLNLRELSTLLHFHTEGLNQSSSLKQARSKSAPPPLTLPEAGTLIGTNSFQGVEKKIFIGSEDRLRHLYVIGQTGTGKSTLLKNMVINDIRSGQGVCMIDPHGSDIQDILASVPPERRDDVIYFDPASTARPMALNMLEYDPRFPEQKTFVVNELFSIFQKLYGGVPESMGPMFEQYFRNATMLVIEDPESGCTLLDVSRVLADKAYRDLKLSRCKNPIITQFWTEVAGKAGGEASLANIVPYITSKFDVFLSNDIMRPIIAQEKSSFNFREIMDQKKILLVNLSKGRLGDINANLIGLIIVGKILMAALSRVDAMGKDFPPFYLTIDEFQNITTDSISTILSEARKYKLSLTIAHQFIAQIDERIRDAVFGNVGSLCAFRIGQDDADYLEKQFSPVFTAADLASIDNFNAHAKLLVSGKPTEPFDFRLIAPEKRNAENLEALKELSYMKYGRDRGEVEAAIMRKYQKTEGKPA